MEVQGEVVVEVVDVFEVVQWWRWRKWLRLLFSQQLKLGLIMLNIC